MHCANSTLSGSARRGPVPVCSSKGFGAPAKKPGQAKGKGTARTPDQAADQALAASTQSRPHVRPINPKEASRGKVDYVQVKDWANGEAGDIGELQVVPDSYNAAYAIAPGTSGDSSGAAAAAGGGPFYQQLARHAQYLESQGALSIALEPGAKPFSPFESWQYSLPRYRQYMAELAAVHLALEQALQLALAAPPQQSPISATAASTTTHNSSSSSSSTRHDQAVQSLQQPWAVPGRTPAALAAYSALACFAADSGLWRAHAAQSDLAALAELAAGRHQAHEQQEQQHQHQVQHGRHPADIHPSQNAVAYGKYLLQLGRSAAIATAAASSQGAGSRSSSSSSSLLAEEDEGTADALKLLAHAYALHVQQQCLGTRIGAAATDHLGLMAAGVAATAVYTDYPLQVKEPLQQLIAVTDESGRRLDAAGKQAVMDELPKALKKATLMLAPLATA